MNPRLLSLTLLCAAVVSLPVRSRADNSGIAIRVEQDVKSEMGKATRGTHVQNRGLTVYVSNNSTASADLKVKYYIFGRDAVSHGIVSLGQGEKPVTVKPSATEKVDIASVSSTATDAHYDTKAKKAVPASGSSIIGSGVQVYLAEKMVAESYDPPSMKDEWGKASPATSALAVKAAAAATPAKK